MINDEDIEHLFLYVEPIPTFESINVSNSTSKPEF
jgi:hypothetical protein